MSLGEWVSGPMGMPESAPWTVEKRVSRSFSSPLPRKTVPHDRSQCGPPCEGPEATIRAGFHSSPNPRLAPANGTGVQYHTDRVWSSRGRESRAERGVQEVIRAGWWLLL